MSRWLAALMLVAAPLWAGGSIDFDGNDDGVDFGQLDTLDGATSLTIEMWAYRDNASATHYLLATGDGSNDHVRLAAWYNDFDEIEAIVRVGSGDVCAVDTAGDNFTAGVWHHVAMTWAGGDPVVYINGVAQAQTGTFGTCTGSSVYSSNVGDYCWGQRTNANPYDCSNATKTADAIDGRLAHLRIYAVTSGSTGALSADDIKDRMYCIEGRGTELLHVTGMDPSTQYDLSPNKVTGALAGDAAESNAGPPVYHCGGGPQ